VFGIGMPELIIIAIVVMVIFGAGKVPEVMGQVGKGLKNFKKGVQYNPREDKDALEKEE